MYFGISGQLELIGSSVVKLLNSLSIDLRLLVASSLTGIVVFRAVRHAKLANKT